MAGDDLALDMTNTANDFELKREEEARKLHRMPTAHDLFNSKMYFSHWKPPGVSERMWSVNLDASISGEYQTLGGYSCRPSE